EFELRYIAYEGLNYKFDLGRDQDTIIELTKITNKGTTDKKIQDITPEEIHDLTNQTYSKYKKDFIEKNEKINLYPDEDKYKLGDYIERLEYELKVIKEMGFNTYFLIVSDFVSWAKEKQIVVGPGRGSGAGSLLARVTKITDIDPMPFGLLFERFLNPARVNMPDFDIDFEDTQRERVIEYVKGKYGEENVCAIGTFMQMATRAAFKDAARAIGVPFDKSNKFSSLIPDKTGISQAIKDEGNEELKSMYNNDDNIKKAVKFGEELEGNMRQLGVHACGIIIAPNKINTFTPTQYAKEDDHNIVSQYDGPTLENIGLLKMDFLGLRNLSIIKNCIKIIKKRYEKEGKNLPKIFESFFKDASFQPPIDDHYTYDKVFKEGDTSGIFQFESKGMRRFLIKLEPDNINDLVAMNALYRPGPMEFIPNYIDRKHGKEPVNYMHNELKNTLQRKYGKDVVAEEEKKLIEDLGPIMDITYGIAVYQEQLMFLVQNMAGFSLAEADILRRGVGKKKKEIIEKLKIEFTERGQTHKGYKPETTKFIYEKMIEPAASYSFNKSHSVCYAWIAYQTAYLKAYFPVEFYAALIRSVEEDTEDQAKYVYETQSHGIEVLQPDINESFNHVAAIEGKIRLGFLGIKGIGFDIGEYIQQERQKNGKYSSLENFLKRCDKVINKKSLEGLIKSGGLDNFFDRNTLLNNIKFLLERSKSSQNMSMGLFGGDETTTKISFNKIEGTSFEEKLMMEQDVFKSFVSGHPLDGLYPYLKSQTFLSRLNIEKNIGPFKITGYISNIQRARKKGYFIEIEDISSKREFFFKDVLDFKKFDLVIISGFKQEGRYPRISKLIKTDRETLIKNAGGKFNPEVTVTKAKGMRLGEVKMELLEDDTQTIKDKKTQDKIIEKEKQIKNKTEDKEDNKTENKKKQTKFEIPNNVSDISKLKEILETNPGNTIITIGNAEKNISKEGLEQVQNLLIKE
ncbi:MAG TPA: DNA polymerase III subunit alpha, partial [Candidatus Absconditabacterales bacterium]|nr:DNA polymerase III subunit alpha [Candidatus Absconditabacterales bacterium]